MTQRTRVLVADPDKAARMLLRQTLSGPGTRICGEVSTAPQASVAVRHTQPDVVLAALRLPGGLHRLIRHLADECGVPSIVVGSSYDDADVLACVRSGVSAIVLADDPDLVAVVHRVAEGEAVLSGRHLALVLEELRSVELAAERRRRGTCIRLTEREWDVVELLRRGSSTSEIASELGIAPVTVRTHISAILRRLHVTTRDEAVERLLPAQRSGDVLTHLNAVLAEDQGRPADAVLPSGTKTV